MIDQKQHLELTCNIAQRFNSIYGNIFTIPEMLISKSGSRIMSLRNPSIKMSKSDTNLNNIITLLEDKKSVITKINCAITDSDNPPSIFYNPIMKPGVSNLLNILSGLTNTSIKGLEKFFLGKMYKYLKSVVIDAILDFIIPLQTRYYMFRTDEDYLNQIAFDGAKKAFNYANLTLLKVYKKIGLI